MSKQTVKIKEAKGRPMLTWVGKRPLRQVTAFPAQKVETFDPSGEAGERDGACCCMGITKRYWPGCWRTATGAR